jgi:hypothetical protein
MTDKGRLNGRRGAGCGEAQWEDELEDELPQSGGGWVSSLVFRDRLFPFFVNSLGALVPNFSYPRFDIAYKAHRS